MQRLDPFDAGDALRIVYREYAAKFGKSRWGDKTPGYVRYMPAIERVLPEAHFVHVIREITDYREGGRVVATVEVWHKIHALTRVPPDRSRIGIWRDEMSADEVATFEAIAGETLAALGYN